MRFMMGRSHGFRGRSVAMGGTATLNIPGPWSWGGAYVVTPAPASVMARDGGLPARIQFLDGRWLQVVPGRPLGEMSIDAWRVDERSPALGQDSWLGDIGDLFEGDLWEKARSYIDVLKADDPKWPEYRDRFNTCINVFEKGDPISLGIAGKCIYDLYKDVKEYWEDKEKEPAPPPPVEKPPPSTGTDLLPILLAAAAGAGAIFLLK